MAGALAGLSTAARLAAAALLVGAAVLPAQQRDPRWREVRLDGLWAGATAVQGGVGAGVAVNQYTRVGGVLGAGAAWRDGRTEPSARADVLMRLILDPFGQQRRAPYVIAGGGIRYERHARTRGVLVLMVGVEGRRNRRLTPAIEVGYGGGFRAGVVFRTRMEGLR